MILITHLFSHGTELTTYMSLQHDVMGKKCTTVPSQPTYDQATWIVIGETFIDADHIFKMYSIKLSEHARKEMEDVSRAVRIELSSVDRTI